MIDHQSAIQGEKSLLRYWIIANIVGVIVGGVIGWGVGNTIRLLLYSIHPQHSAGDISIVSLTITLGISIGLAQWLILVKRFSWANKWGLTSMVGWPLGGTLSWGISGLFFYPPTLESWATIMQLFMVILIGGGVTSGLQWLILRQNFNQASRWVMVSIVGWIVAGGIGVVVGGLAGAFIGFGLVRLLFGSGTGEDLPVMMLIGLAFSVIPMFLISSVLGGFIYGVITWQQMTQLLRNPLPVGSIPSSDVPPDKSVGRSNHMFSWFVSGGGALILGSWFFIVGMQACGWLDIPLNFSGCEQLLRGHSDAITSINVNQSGKILASASNDKTVRLWATNNGEVLYTLRGHQHWVSDVDFSPDGNIVASGSWDKTVRLWQTQDGKLIRILEKQDDPIQIVKFSPDGTILASGTRHIQLWHVEDGRLLNVLKVEDGYWVNGLAFSPDGSVIASGSGNTIHFWKVDDGALISTITHGFRIASLDFSPDGSIIASAADNNNDLKLWHVADGTVVRTLTGHAGRIADVEFSPDGTMLAAASYDDTVRLWQVGDGKLLRTFEGHNDFVRSVAFTPDGTSLISGSQDETIRTWHVQ